MTDRSAAGTPPEMAEPSRAREGTREARAADKVHAAEAVPAHLRFGLAALVALALFGATYLMFVTTETGQRAENLALRGVELRSAIEREAALERLAQVTVIGFALAVSAVFVTGLVRRRGGLGSLAAAVMIASVLAAEFLKAVLPRPELVTGPAWLLRNSFPSGSAAVATSFAIGALLVAPRRARFVVLPLGATYAAVVGDAVQTIGWHRLSDTIGATLLVSTVGFVGLALLARAGLVHRSGKAFVDRGVTRVLGVASLVVLLIGGVLLLFPAAFPVLAAPGGARRAFLQAAFPLVGAGVTVFAITLFARVIEPYTLGRTGAPVDERADPRETAPPLSP